MQGMAVKRGERGSKGPGNLPSRIRKKSAYGVFKSKFLASEAVKKMKEDGVTFADIQRQGSLAYQQLPENERQEYEALAANANEGFVPSSSSSLSKEKMIRRLIQNISSNMKQLDELGCPSIWLGHGEKVPERLHSPQMVELAEDQVFNNYVLSVMMKKMAGARMKNIASAKEQSDKRKKEEEGKKEPAKRRKKEIHTTTKPTNTDAPKSPENSEISGAIGEEVEILSAEGAKLGHGVITDQKIVHGRELTYGWIPLMVRDICPHVKPWKDFPTHSDIVEKDSFVAWPKTYLKPAK